MCVKWERQPSGNVALTFGDGEWNLAKCKRCEFSIVGRRGEASCGGLLPDYGFAMVVGVKHADVAQVLRDRKAICVQKLGLEEADSV
jgi:hypothetical protein